MKLATTTGDFQTYSASHVERVKLFKGTGFKYLDLNLYRERYDGSPFLDNRWDAIVDELGTIAADLGFTFIQAHSPDGRADKTGHIPQDFIDDTIRSIETCGELGIPNIVVHSIDFGGHPSREHLRRKLEINRKFYHSLLPTMEKTGVHVLLENGTDTHAPTKQLDRRIIFATASQLLDLLDVLDHPLFGICWDTGHANIHGCDQYLSLCEIGSHLHGMHIVDNYGDLDSHTAPFQGTTNFDSVMQALIDIGYPGWFTFEASNILRGGKAWPHYRHEWSLDGEGNPPPRLFDVPLETHQQAIALLYQIGKSMLSAYNCFEE